MVISDTSHTIDGLPLLYWRRNLGKSGQVWAKLGLRKSRTTLGKIARAVRDKGSIDEYYGDFP